MGYELLLLIVIACCLVYLLATSFRTSAVDAGVSAIALLLVLILLFGAV